MGRAKLLSCLVFQFITCANAASAFAIDAIADLAENAAHWHVSEKTLTATFLGGDKPESAVLVLSKPISLGRTLTINSDGAFIIVQSGKETSPHVTFQLTGNAEGVSNKLLLTGGDQPSVFLNDKEQVQQQGKWIQIFCAADSTIRLEIGNATFAKIIFEPSLTAKPTIAQVPAPVAPAAPVKDLLHLVTARQLQLASDNFHEGVLKKCSRCSGTGSVTIRVQTGTQQSGILSYPIFENQRQRCEKCNATGIDRSSNETLIRLSGVLVKDMALLKEDDLKRQETLTKVYTEITDRMIGDQKTWSLLTANGKSILAQRDPLPGSTVVSLVQVKQSVKQSDDHRRFLVRVIGTDKEVFVDDPTLADELSSGHALMGGLIDKSLPNASGIGHTTVLRGGFLIAPEVNHDWYWWYKDFK